MDPASPGYRVILDRIAYRGVMVTRLVRKYRKKNFRSHVIRWRTAREARKSSSLTFQIEHYGCCNDISLGGKVTQTIYNTIHQTRTSDRTLKTLGWRFFRDCYRVLDY